MLTKRKYIKGYVKTIRSRSQILGLYLQEYGTEGGGIKKHLKRCELLQMIDEIERIENVIHEHSTNTKQDTLTDGDNINDGV